MLDPNKYSIVDREDGGFTVIFEDIVNLEDDSIYALDDGEYETFEFGVSYEQ